MAEKTWERQIVEMTSLFFLLERSRRVEEAEEGDSDVVRIKQPETSLEIGLLLLLLLLLNYCLSFSQRNILVPSPVRSCRWFLQDSFILSFSLKT